VTAGSDDVDHLTDLEAPHAAPRFDGLRALFVNATLKRSPEPSNTDGLVRLSSRIMREHGVQVEAIRAVDHDIATGVWPDMTAHGWERRRVAGDPPTGCIGADILVLAGPRSGWERSRR
jgi:hypothetical protein